jgi:hypothetical protein
MASALAGIWTLHIADRLGEVIGESMPDDLETNVALLQARFLRSAGNPR